MTDFTLPSIDSAEWIAIDPQYKPYLRIKLLVNLLPFWVASLIAWWFMPPGNILSLSGVFFFSSALVTFYLWSYCVWVPKRCLRMCYLMRDLDVSLQQGYLFWSTISVSINRIQHLEVTQGPIQRSFGLAVLSIYTAGTVGSDLKIPGLTIGEAQRIKKTLLKAVNLEAPVDV